MTVYLQRFLPQLTCPLVQVPVLSFVAAAGVSRHHLLLELFLKVLFLLGFEAWQPSEQLPRFLHLDLEALLLVQACSPEFSTPPQLLWPLAHKLRLIEASPLLVASTRRFSVSSSTAAVSWARVVDRGRTSLKLPLGGLRPLSSRKDMPGTGGRLVAVTQRERTARRAVVSKARALGDWLVVQPWRLAAHLEDFVLRLSCQFRRQCRR